MTTRRAMLAMPLLAAGQARAQTGIAAALAPGGTLRVAINFGNPVLAQRDPAGGAPRGVSAVLATEIGRRLNLPVQWVPFQSAGSVTDAVGTGAFDLCFLAIDPVRARGIQFTAPYVVIEGGYLVRADSPLRQVEEVDRAGIRVSVGRGSAYDLFLTRALRHAELVRAPTSPEAIEVFRRERLDAAAGVKRPLNDYARDHADVRVLPGRFMQIEQAVGIPQGRDAAMPWLAAFVEEAKASGLVARALAATGQADAEVAPPRP